MSADPEEQVFHYTADEVVTRFLRPFFYALQVLSIEEVMADPVGAVERYRPDPTGPQDTYPYSAYHGE